MKINISQQNSSVTKMRYSKDKSLYYVIITIITVSKIRRPALRCAREDPYLYLQLVIWVFAAGSDIIVSDTSQEVISVPAPACFR